MEFLMAHWLLFLLSGVASGGVAIAFQLRNMKRIVTFEAIEQPGSFISGFVPAVIFGLLGSLSLILAFIGVAATLLR